MKKIFRNKLVAIPLSLLLVLGLASGIVYAIYGLSASSHVKIIEAPPPEPEPQIKLAFYKDEACTEPCTFIEWGELEQGQTETKPGMFYVKNIGDIKVSISGVSTLSPDVGTLEIEYKKNVVYVPTVPLDVGEVAKVKGIMEVEGDSVLGDVDFSIIVEAH